MAATDLSRVTFGITPVAGRRDPILSGGLATGVSPYAPPNKLEAPVTLKTGVDPTSLGINDPLILASLASIRDANGKIIDVAGAPGPIDLGNGATLVFDQDSLAGRITPVIANQLQKSLDEGRDGALYSYTGSDMKVMVEIAEPPAGVNLPVRMAKQLIECTTLSVSVHREKAPVRATGYINAKGFARGKRTIAGTLVFTQFTAEVLLRFLQSVLMSGDTSKDSFYMKVDQLPPFNMTLIFANEHGYASYRRILGVEFVTDGPVYSINDLLTEQSISYMAADFTPLLPLDLSSLYRPSNGRSGPGHQHKTVESVLRAQAGRIDDSTNSAIIITPISDNV
jgi:hypothetical protein